MTSQIAGAAPLRSPWDCKRNRSLWDAVREFDAGIGDRRVLDFLEAQHHGDTLLYPPMVLFHQLAHVFMRHVFRILFRNVAFDAVPCMRIGVSILATGSPDRPNTLTQAARIGSMESLADGAVIRFGCKYRMSTPDVNGPEPNTGRDTSDIGSRRQADGSGTLCQAASARTAEVRHPSSGRVITSLACGDATDMDTAVTAAFDELT